MQAIIYKYGKFTLSVIFGMIVFWFWEFHYPCYLSYQEQFQMFLFDKSYFLERIIIPEGLTNYISEFLTQFYYIPWIGACILSFIYVFMQRVIWILAKHEGVADTYYPLSFIPVLIVWFYMGDENAMLSYVLALLTTLAMAWWASSIKKRWKQFLFYLISIPSLFWLIGATVSVFVGYIIILTIKNRTSKFNAAGYSIGIIIYYLACVLCASMFLQYPFFRIFGGIGYYRFPAVIPVMQIVIMIIFSVFPFLLPMLPLIGKKKTIKIASEIAIIVIGGIFLVKSGFDELKYELIDYDYLVRHEQWQKIIEKAEKKQASTPMGVACVNLALAMQNQLSDHMFEFYQNGAEGLLPPFQRDFTSLLPTSEAFYRLGMINTAQRYMFEAQEAIPNFNKSGRCTKRIAETNIINGQYRVAAKYLRMLQKTLFYKDWADNAMTYLNDENKINNHPVWGRLRQYRYTKDFLFSDTELDQMLGILFVRNHNNKMAYEYLIAYELLQRDIQKFLAYYPLGKYAHFDHIPRSYQQILVYLWTQNHPNFDGMPWSIDEQVMQNVTEFARLYVTNPKDPTLETGVFGNTYWSYLLVKKNDK